MNFKSAFRGTDDLKKNTIEKERTDPPKEEPVEENKTSENKARTSTNEECLYCPVFRVSISLGTFFKNLFNERLLLNFRRKDFRKRDSYADKRAE